MKQKFWKKDASELTEDELKNVTGITAYKSEMKKLGKEEKSKE